MGHCSEDSLIIGEFLPQFGRAKVWYFGSPWRIEKGLRPCNLERHCACACAFGSCNQVGSCPYDMQLFRKFDVELRGVPGTMLIINLVLALQDLDQSLGRQFGAELIAEHYDPRFLL